MNCDTFIFANSPIYLCICKTQIDILFAFVTESDVVDIILQIPQVAQFLRAFLCELAVSNILVALPAASRTRSAIKARVVLTVSVWWGLSYCNYGNPLGEKLSVSVTSPR